MILRSATLADAPMLATIHIAAMRTLTFLPQLHTVDEATGWMTDVVLPARSILIAERGGAPCGYIATSDGWVDQLYVHPDQHGQGVGARLLAEILADGAPRQLWTFQDNARARGFYERRGFEAVEFTDGAGNEEKTPDVRYFRPGGSASAAKIHAGG